jgi:hypothetical protein
MRRLVDRAHIGIFRNPFHDFRKLLLRRNVGSPLEVSASGEPFVAMASRPATAQRMKKCRGALKMIWSQKCIGAFPLEFARIKLGERREIECERVHTGKFLLMRSFCAEKQKAPDDAGAFRFTL